MYCDGKLEVVTTHDVIQLFASTVTALHRSTPTTTTGKTGKHRRKENNKIKQRSKKHKNKRRTPVSQHEPVPITSTDRQSASTVDPLSVGSKPVFRRILHDWMEENGTLKTYTGEVQFMQDNGQCILHYDGFNDKYFLTVDELFEDYVNGDLRFI
uniref:Uncharacterized protein n=1 Tax=Ditylenchus dipsaci TaxID=166011 RepID=A0A915D0R1_9BILA